MQKLADNGIQVKALPGMPIMLTGFNSNKANHCLILGRPSWSWFIYKGAWNI
jgi:hypothetical protein